MILLEVGIFPTYYEFTPIKKLTIAIHPIDVMPAVATTPKPPLVRLAKAVMAT